MEILGSTTYVDLSKQTEPWYQLKVTNQWDWLTKSICSESLPDGFVVWYHLKHNTPISSDRYQSDTVLEITEEIKEELINMGLTIRL